MEEPEGEKPQSKDILTLLCESSANTITTLLILCASVRSNMSHFTQHLCTSEFICQITTFVAAGIIPFTFARDEADLHDYVGHETTASALTWSLYALARAPHAQARLRESLHAIPISSASDATASDIQAILDEPYLDACVRECLRLHCPVTSTMRVAAHADVIPVSSPFRDRDGRLCDHIRVNQGDIVTIPIQAMQKAALAWGDDAEEFRPEIGRAHV